MTPNQNHDEFEHRFTDAVNRAHERADARARPSSQVWDSIRAELPQLTQRAEAADPRAMGPDPVPMSRRTQRKRKEAGMDVALRPPMAAPSKQWSREFLAWVAIALVGVVVASSVFWAGQPPAGDNGNQLAWAPGPGSPVSTPMVGQVCDAEPLSTDEVMAIVRNPRNTYTERGHTISSDEDDMSTYSEARIDWSQRAATPSMLATGDPALVEPLTELGNSFWSCLVSGTSAQVWAMMDPSLLQWTILQNFDVVRTEDDIQQFVEEWSAQPYASLPGGLYPQFIDPDENEIAYVVDDELGGTKISKARGLPGEESRAGVIRMVSAPESQSSGFYEIYVTENPDGSWFVTWVEPSPETDRDIDTPGG